MKNFLKLFANNSNEDESKEAQVYSWLFLSTALACQEGSASIKSISKIADGINQAVPTQKEIQFSMKWLVKKGLVNKIGKRYNLSLTGKTIYKQASKNLNQTAEISDFLATRFTRIILGKEHIPEFSRELYLITLHKYDKQEAKKITNSLKKLNKINDSNSDLSSRLIAALIKIGSGSIRKFDQEITTCKIDWRDTLMSSGFGNDINEHKSWIADQIVLIQNSDFFVDDEGLLIL